MTTLLVDNGGTVDINGEDRSLLKRMNLVKRK
jgi:hypothetical protein